MSRRRSLSDEERALWTGIARSIKPLHPARRAAAETSDLAPSGRHSTKSTDKSSAEPVGKPSGKALARNELSRLRAVAPDEPNVQKKAPPLAPLERKLKRRVTRGHEPIDARLDLHGFTQTQAHGALLAFLQRAQADGVRVALVVTGKGTRKADEAYERGVLKRQVPHWLSLPQFRPLVVGYEDAHLAHGGAGALYIRVRRALRDDE
jgi:DNA-nicking Smr family endonuclease